MERKYYRQYEPYKKIIPRQEDFPVLEFKNEANEITNEPEKKEIASKNNILPFDLKLDDIIILAVLIMLLSESEKDSITIIVLAFLFLSEYIF